MVTRQQDWTEFEVAAMREAISLARHGRQTAAPNPMVGCVMAQGNRIVGRGWHQRPGGDHAEVAAIKDAKGQTEGATAFVTLEPCNHIGRTGPCTEALIDAGVVSVVYSVDDPNPIAAGGGQRLKTAGLNVRTGLLEDDCRSLIRGWLHSHTSPRPYVVAKVAMSLDGRIATHSGQSKWLTGPDARRRGHLLRADADAIMVGANTIKHDDPSLTARLENDVFTPLRVVVDSQGSCPSGAKAFERSGSGAVILTTKHCPASRIDRFKTHGIDVDVCSTDPEGRVDLEDALLKLRQKGVLTLMVEGGGTVVGSLLDHDFIDELHLFYAPIVLGGGRAGFNGRGVDAIQEAHGFNFLPPEPIGNDFVVVGHRRRG
ncbi:MAG: bifunctional diaminohydroxyphosphoribosylaminopyrimidine deaminase/5-amino-6-(5-phosphoribosylamino)uracil reductase RibD [Pseudomonadota bacterium]